VLNDLAYSGKNYTFAASFIIMAKPIAITPTLTGKDAELFLKRAHEPVKTVSQQEFAACKSAYQMMQQMAQ